MPHFIMDCSADVLNNHDEQHIIKQIHLVANQTGLFDEGDIKVRVNAYNTYLVGNKQESFIHIFAHIMQGRTIEQKADLSRQMVTMLTSLFPDTPNIAMNVSDFEKATYCNRAMV
ncbi:5-carboxymethyl-2-hydroxymuconate Delta-isomerase [Shewanella maritima]|uniref:5-carboxymethyl-2-hydroxymuconate Delta-isomerase n=1 Tax=Shewanella maritima TaxID=2520507 RepID=A0A411PDF3_9GAMM|nr:5-carboxymethyl-2-hydroxymuconate Delta-isomerase [Shewanella maritima]QBF81595.1 5-carboxymethyl-2-hydroxymuconate Delta-isomerase [Shewanella maritima]